MPEYCASIVPELEQLLHNAIGERHGTRDYNFACLSGCCTPKVDIRPLAELFRASVLKMLKDEERLDDTLIKKILTWRHNSGFSVNNEVRLQAGDAKGIENVAQYIIHNSFSLAKLSYS